METSARENFFDKIFAKASEHENFSAENISQTQNFLGWNTFADETSEKASQLKYFYQANLHKFVEKLGARKTSGLEIFLRQIFSRENIST